MIDFDTAGADWDTQDESGYQNPHDYDPTAIDPGMGEENTELPDATDAADQPAAQVEPKYATVVEWVEQFFVQVIRRRIIPAAGEGLSWDGRWWLYPEVVARLTALHYAWEEARASDKPSAMSAWWIHHLEPHVRVIFDSESGPMSNATGDGSFSGWPALPAAPVPTDLFDVIVPSQEGQS